MAYPRESEFADMLYKAGADLAAINALTDIDPSFTAKDAYGVQTLNVERWMCHGRLSSGKKIGLTSHAIQAQFGVNEPDYGCLFEDMSHDDGCKLNMADFLQPKIEAEIAFFLKSDLSGGSVTEGDVLAATDYVVASFEIVDSRIRDWKLKLPDTIADNASAGCYVLGKRLFAAGSVDLASVKMQLLRNGHPAGEGFGGDVMGSPYRTVAWLSNKLWEYGVELRKGELILSGALSAASAVSKGDMFEARFSDLGRITVEFV